MSDTQGFGGPVTLQFPFPPALAEQVHRGERNAALVLLVFPLLLALPFAITRWEPLFLGVMMGVVLFPLAVRQAIPVLRRPNPSVCTAVLTDTALEMVWEGRPPQRVLWAGAHVQTAGAATTVRQGFNVATIPHAHPDWEQMRSEIHERVAMAPPVPFDTRPDRVNEPERLEPWRGRSVAHLLRWRSRLLWGFGSLAALTSVGEIVRRYLLFPDEDFGPPGLAMGFVFLTLAVDSLGAAGNIALQGTYIQSSLMLSARVRGWRATVQAVVRAGMGLVCLAFGLVCLGMALSGAEWPR